MIRLSISAILAVFVFASISYGQVTTRQEIKPEEQPTPPLQSTVAQIGEVAVSQEKRAQSYAKLLEAQRYIWTARATNSVLAQRTANRLAKESLRKAVELNPRLAEGYTALAELALRETNSDVNEAISLATIATRIDPDNFGANKLLGRLFTLKSGLRQGKVDSAYVAKAITSWKHVSRLDPRNAEAWAFLAEFYKKLGDGKSRIAALRNWLSSAETNDAGFYLRLMRGSEGLSPGVAAVPLGEALLAEGMKDEALSILARAVSDNPENLLATDLLGRALETGEIDRLKPAIEALQQAVYSNPDNLSLVQMLAETLARTGDIDAAASTIDNAVGKLNDSKGAALLLALGDIYSDREMIDEAMSSYRSAFRKRGIVAGKPVRDGDRGFALLVIGKIVQTLQRSGRVSDAEDVIDSSKGLFSVDDYVMDREKISLMRATGRRAEALNLVRSLRQRAPEDYNLIRKEAELLTDLGKVDQAAALIVPLIEDKTGNETRSIKYDDFVNRLFIAGLFIQADRGKDAIFHAEKAFAVANGDQSKQLATLQIASAQVIDGNFNAAEKNLVDILKATPNNPMALNDLGFLYLRKNTNYDQALDLIEKAVSIDPRNPVYLDSLGLAHLKLGNLDKAEEFLRRSIRYDFSSVTAFERLGDVLLKKGLETEAQTIWKKALTVAIKGSDVARIEKKIGL